MIDLPAKGGYFAAMNLPQVPVPDGYRLRDVQFEMSLKPFYDTSPQTRRAVIEEALRQWSAVWRHAETVSILLWIGDGSEILEYDGDLERPFEWGRYQGSANAHEWKLPRKTTADNPDEDALGMHARDPAFDPEGRGLHARSYLYRPNPAAFTFAWLRDLVRDIRRIGRRTTGRRVFVGETFDIGPEFAVSRFKYAWHPEILAGGDSLFKGQWVSCGAVLHGDTRRYAAFPQGIPEGTPFGVFLGRQLRHFFRDIGFDFLWLSNGFGFALEPWAMVGALFDGERFKPERAAEARDRILGFWRDLRRGFPARYPIRTRGTNLATGIDLGSDASPLRDIYDPKLRVDAPVNSPWASIDGDFGLELSGWMSHVARHPGETFRHRYYVHDPWWKNSPYLDRFERNPHDLFLPASVSRVRADGTTEIPRDFAVLTVDDSDGRLHLSAAAEVSAHFLRAREFAPDAPGPMIWAYPFDAFHDEVFVHGRPDIPFHADALAGTFINEAVPLNTVLDLGDLPAALRARPDLAEGRIFFSPVPRPGSAAETSLRAALDAGGHLFLYGPLPDASAFAAPLGVRSDAPLEGDFDLDLKSVPAGERMEGVGRRLRHTALLSAGGFAEAPAAAPPAGAEHRALARQGAAARVAAARNGRLLWMRGSLSTAEYDPAAPAPIRGPILKPLPLSQFFPFGRLARFLLAELGWSAAVADPASVERTPCITIHRCRNAFQYSGYQPDENSRLLLRHPLGAPLFTFRRQRIVAGATEVAGARAWSYEARVFAASGGDGIYRCRYLMPVGYGVYRRLLIGGCRNATLTFLTDTGAANPIRILRNPVFPYYAGDFVPPVVRPTPWGPAITVEHVEGSLMIEW